MSRALHGTPGARTGIRFQGCPLPEALVRLLRRAYEGNDPARQDSLLIAAPALAEAFAVHENTVYLLVSKQRWQRPGWYRKPNTGRPPQQARQSRIDRLLAVLRCAADQGAPCPTTMQICEASRIKSRDVRRLLSALVDQGALKIEHRGSNTRRVVFADGRATGWTVPKPKGHDRRTRESRARPASTPVAVGVPVIDLAARDALSRLRRRAVAFDCGVHSGRWGERWSVDGKLVDRAGLLQLGAQS